MAQEVLKTGEQKREARKNEEQRRDIYNNQKKNAASQTTLYRERRDGV